MLKYPGNPQIVNLFSQVAVFPARSLRLSDLVETYSGHRLHEKPLRFQKQGSWYRVVKIVARWQKPGVLGFRVLAEDGKQYTLEYIQEQDVWKVGK
jgi:hypothetical protein